MRSSTHYGCVEEGKVSLEVTIPKGPEDRKGKGRFFPGNILQEEHSPVPQSSWLLPHTAQCQTSALQKGDKSTLMPPIVE